MREPEVKAWARLVADEVESLPKHVVGCAAATYVIQRVKRFKHSKVTQPLFLMTGRTQMLQGGDLASCVCFASIKVMTIVTILRIQKVWIIVRTCKETHILVHDLWSIVRTCQRAVTH